MGVTAGLGAAPWRTGRRISRPNANANARPNANAKTRRARATAMGMAREEGAGPCSRDGRDAEVERFEKRRGGRRDALVSTAGALVALGVMGSPKHAEAVQGLTAGRIPGLSAVGSDGLRTYTRPEGKSGGHGIGWSEVFFFFTL